MRSDFHFVAVTKSRLSYLVAIDFNTGHTRDVLDKPRFAIEFYFRMYFADKKAAGKGNVTALVAPDSDDRLVQGESRPTHLRYRNEMGFLA